MTRPHYSDVTIPFSQNDINNNILHTIANLVATGATGFASLQLNDIKDVFAVGFGYQSAADIFPTEITTFDVAQLPEHNMQLYDFIAWRMYLTGKVSIVDAYQALFYIWPRVRLDVMYFYKWIGLRIDTNSSGPVYGNSYKFLDDIKKIIPKRKQELRDDGKLFIHFRAETAAEIADIYWEKNSGVKQAKLVSDIVDAAWVDLEEEVRFHATVPSGFCCLSIYDMYGSLIGHGIHAKKFNGHLQNIYPPDGEAFVKACIDIWNNRPLKPMPRFELPAVVYADEYRNPFSVAVIKRKVPAEVELELADVEGVEREALTIKDGLISFGYDFVYEGSHYSRPSIELVADDFENSLGLTLVPRNEVVEEVEGQFDWLYEKVPYGIDKESLDLLIRLEFTINKLREEEIDWLQQAGNFRAVDQIVIETSEHERHVMAQCSEGWMQGKSGFVQQFDVPNAGLAILKIYPQLNSLPIDVIGEYGLDYWGKNGIRNDREYESGDRLFLNYVVLRNLGCDPLASFSGYSKQWIAIFRLVRLAIEKVPHTERTKDTYQEIGYAARTLILRCKKMLDLFDSLDSSLDELW